MEGPLLPLTFDAKIQRIRFGLAPRQEICKASISDCPISHASQLSNPFLGLPLESGKCESCGTGEAGQCEGHFGYIEFPTPIYHPDHVGELRRMLTLLCLKCLKLKSRKLPAKNTGIVERVLSACCEEASQVTINEARTTDGACYLELKVPLKSYRGGCWNFLEKYGFRYGDNHSRPLLPSEVMTILRKIPQETKKKLSAKGYFPQDGYIIQCLPVPPNCLSVPDISDGISTMSTDHSISLLRRVLRQVEIIKSSRSGKPNFESQEIEANDLQAAVVQYLQFRGTGKASRDVDARFGVHKEAANVSSTKAWLEKMKTLFIRKGSGYSSRSVITGDPFKGVSEIGLPFEIAQKITIEERVNEHNREFLQKLVDDKLCLTYRDGMSTYSLKEGSKGHTSLRPGQVVHRRIMNGDIVFINRPPTTHKHSLQSLSVYVHDDHTVKINPLICGPLSADFDGDCIHLFYPQSLEAKAEAAELFAVEKQLLSSHTGNFNLQIATDSLLSLKILFKKCFLKRAAAEQLAMFVPNQLSKPALLKSDGGPLWTASQILQLSLPPDFSSHGERHHISRSEVLSIDFSRDAMASIVNDLVTSLFFLEGPEEVLKFFNHIQPLLMESLYSEGFSVSLRDFFLPREALENTLENIQKICADFIVNSSAIGYLIDSKSESALNKVVQQIGFLGKQISGKGKFYTDALVKDMSSMFDKKYPSRDNYPVGGFGSVDRPLFRGLDPYQEMVHSISSREVIVRSSRGLSEPGTLFKNLMAILRDVVICQDGTVRNMCSNSIIQFEYGINSASVASQFCAGDPVGVLAATAMSNPAYKAVLDSSPSSNNSWEMMKEILLCGVNFKNDVSDRRIILCLNNCNCGRKHCQENTALTVLNQLKKVTLKDVAFELLIEYRAFESSDTPGLVGHVHLNKSQLLQLNTTADDILEKCQETIDLHQKKKKVGSLFKKVQLACSNCCSFCLSSKDKANDVPCIQFLLHGANDEQLERSSQNLIDKVYPVLVQAIIKGDPRVSSANIVWIGPNTDNWIRSPCKSLNSGELALDIILEKEAVKKSGDAWRIVMDSCIPVIQLIDTQRSTPYGIKQIQELLGISCAFEQAVQRLSTSVTMVTKGVLKDHLLLLGNSMTCAGTLIGFNSGGIKYLSKSLDVQVPFMSATLSTPRRTFERAAEKCHADNLSSIVASCAWGKHVSVGTGSPFEIIWDTRKAELSPDKEIDVYDFLRDVSSGSYLDGMDTSCLGAEIEDLDEDMMEFDQSPVRESDQDKPTFDDGAEFGFAGDDANGRSNEDGGWSSWGNKTNDSQVDDWTKKAGSEGSEWMTKPEQNAWGKKVSADENSWAKKPEGGSWGQQGNSKGNLWDKGIDSKEDDWAKKASSLGEKNNSEESSWGKKSEGSTWGEKDKLDSAVGSAWGKNSDPAMPSGGKDWGVNDKPSTPKNDNQSSWGRSTPQTAQEDGGAWGKKGKTSTWAASSPKRPSGQSNWGMPSGGKDWGANKPSTPKTDNQSNWGQNTPQTAQEDGGGWGKEKQSTWTASSPKRPGGQSNWGMPSGGKDWDADKPSTPKTDNQSNWGRKTTQTDVSAKGQEDGAWSSAAQDGSSQATGWNTQGTSKTDNQSNWGRKTTQTDVSAKAQEDGSWSSAAQDGSSQAAGWSTQATPKTDNQSNWGRKTTQTDVSAKAQEDGAWSSAAQDGSSQATGWNTQGTPKTDNQSNWGRKTTQTDVSAKAQEDGAWSSAAQDGSSQATGWNTQGSVAGSLDASDNSWGSKLASQTSQSTPNTWGSSNDWGKFDSQTTKESPSDSWGPRQKNLDDSTGGQTWGSSGDASGDKDARPQWGRGRGRGRGRGWGRGRSREGSQGRGPSNDGEWKPRRNQPNDDPSTPALYSAFKQRLDSFSVEEQDVLAETESTMKTIRRIMSQSADGDPLAAEDQSFIIENVLNYHPEKDKKTGEGIKHIMVTRHEKFQDSRCFYVVSTDDSKADFSYRKCLENSIREKHPDKAEAFISKYFKRPQPRQGWSKPRNEAGTPTPGGWNQDSTSTPTPDEAGTPSWKAATPGWNTNTDAAATTPSGWKTATPGWNTKTDEATATPSGWNKDQTSSATQSGWDKDQASSATPSGWDKDQTPSQDATATDTPTPASTTGWN